MEEQNKKEMNEFRKIFIYIVLYLLLILAFFSEYFVKEGKIGTGAILIFIFGILSLIPLTIIYTKKCKITWAYFSITPFVLIILFNLTILYGMALDIKLKSGLSGFFWNMGQVLLIFFSFNHGSIWAIIILMLIFLIIIKRKI